jgi:hypothetical protein
MARLREVLQQRRDAESRRVAHILKFTRKADNHSATAPLVPGVSDSISADIEDAAVAFDSHEAHNWFEWGSCHTNAFCWANTHVSIPKGMSRTSS